MVAGDSSIRVTVRYRPMNRREKAEEKNGVCVKVSDCHRACQIFNDNTGRNNTFFFDKVYPAGVAQNDVYQYTGRPLVEACLKGYNSTLFAYGQTGSGKTFSMMGVLGTENRGIQPRVIEDLFDHIDNLPADCEDRYNVQISMCEIYMERIKDLLNPVEDNLKVRDSPEKGIYIAGVTEQYCASAVEVLDAMDNGFMNRATSATKMNPESSRSHCVTILKVTKTSANGSVSIAKIKMVDLAGSEKTSKTEATGERLKEAMMINSSLTALSKVLNALAEGSKFIPYRDSKLTRLLQDALGGNSKTSLIVAASPCAFNCEETISSLRFGERAKKVKNNAVINVKLSPDEYKKRCAELEKENGTLKLENELYRLKETELKKFLNAKNYDFNDVVKDVKIGGEEEMSAEGMAFEQVSDQMYEINKKTGQAMGGNAFTVSMNTKKAKLNKAKAEKEENARIAQLVFASIVKGDFEQVGHILQGRCQMSGSVSGDVVDRYEDEIADLKAELRGAENLADQVQDEMDKVNDNMDNMYHETTKLQAALAEHKFYKQKVQFLEKENDMIMKRIKTGSTMMEDDVDADTSDLDLGWAANCSPHVQAQIEKLAQNAKKNASLVKRMKDERCLNMEDIMEAVQGSDKAAAIKKIMQNQIAMGNQLTDARRHNEKAKRAITMLTQKEAHWRELQHNWKQQLQQMEQGVLLCSQIQKRDRTKFMHELKTKDEEIEKLKTYVARLNGIHNKKRRPSAGRAMVKPNRFGVKPKVAPKKRRPARSKVLVAEAGAPTQVRA